MPKIASLNRTTGDLIIADEIEELDEYASFSRSSVAYDPVTGAQVATGVPRYLRGRFHNLLTKNQSDVETDTSGFVGNYTTITRTTADKWQGNAALLCQPNSTGVSRGFYLTPRIPVVPGVTYTFSAYAKQATGGQVNLWCTIEWYNAQTGGARLQTSLGTAVTLNTVSWQRLTVTATAPAGAHWATLTVYTPNSVTPAESWYVDGLQFEEGSAATDWRAGSTGQAVYVEEGTTNLLLYSEDYQQSVWFKGSNISLVSTSVPDPFGGSTAQRWRSNSTNFVYIAQDVTVTAGQTYTLSFWARLNAGANGGYLLLRWYDASNNVLSETKQTSVTVTPQWQRFTLTGTAPTGATKCRVHLLTDFPSGTEIDFWGAQFEAKAYATSYMMTTNAAATRAAETLTFPTDGLSPSAGCVRVWVYVNSMVRRQVSGQYNRVFLLTRDVAGNNGITLRHRPDSAEWQVRTENDARQYSSFTVPDSYTPDGWHLFEVRWRTGEISLLIDGVPRGTISNPYLPSRFYQGYLGSNNGVSEFLNTYFDDLEVLNYYPSDAESAAAYNRGAPATWKQGTVLLCSFDGSLLMQRKPFSLTSSGKLIVKELIEDDSLPSAATFKDGIVTVKGELYEVGQNLTHTWDAQADWQAGTADRVDVGQDGTVMLKLEDDWLDFGGEAANPRQYVEIPGSGVLRDVTDSSFTMEVDFVADTLPAGQDSNTTYSLVFSRPGFHTGVGIDSMGRVISQLWVMNGTTPVNKGRAGTTVFTPGQRIRATYSVDVAANKATLYVNGKQEAEVSLDGLPLRDYGTNVYYIGGGAPLAGNYRWLLDGKVYEVRLWNRALSLAESWKEVQPGEPGLVGWWRLDERGGTVAHDYSGNGAHGTVYNATWGWAYYQSGTWISQPIDLSPVGVAAASAISWQADTPPGTAVTVEASLDGGQTWTPCTNGGPIPGIEPGTDLFQLGARLLVKATLSTTDTSITPILHNLKVEVNHQ